jgi:hypothetical protein
MKKVLRVFAGFGLIIVGLLLAIPFVPGPGTPLVILGLVILGDHFPWAKRIVDWGKAKLEGISPGKRKPVVPESTGTSAAE